MNIRPYHQLPPLDLNPVSKPSNLLEAMAYLRGGDRPFSIHKLLKMLLSPHQSNKPVQQESDMLEDVDEPPDHRFLNTSAMNVDDGVVYVKSPTTMSRGKESLLTRALK